MRILWLLVCIVQELLTLKRPQAAEAAKRGEEGAEKRSDEVWQAAIQQQIARLEALEDMQAFTRAELRLLWGVLADCVKGDFSKRKSAAEALGALKAPNSEQGGTCLAASTLPPGPEATTARVSALLFCWTDSTWVFGLTGLCGGL